MSFCIEGGLGLEQTMRAVTFIESNHEGTSLWSKTRAAPLTVTVSMRYGEAALLWDH